MKRQLEDLYNQYLSKWKESSKQAEKFTKEKETLIRENFLHKISNNFTFLERLCKMHQRKEKRIALGKLLAQKDAKDEADQTIQNTITLGNFLNLLEKKRMEDKLRAFYKWREFASTPNGYRYVKEKNVFGEDIVKFERYQADKMALISVQERKLLAACLIKNILNKNILRNKAYFHRRFELEMVMLTKKQIALALGVLIKEIIIKQKRLFWRRAKAEVRRQKEAVRVPDPSRETTLTKVYYRSFYRMQSNNEFNK